VTNPEKVMEYKNTGMIIYNALYETNDKGEDVPLLYNDETRRYINVRYGSLQVDWEISGTDGAFYYK
jgi:hypothetical protein